MKPRLFIGIDGGGTHSTAVAVWSDGRVAGIAHGEGLNFYNIGVDKVRLRLERMVLELCEAVGAPAERICVGMSALDAPADDETHALFTTGAIAPGQLDLQSDAFIALMGFTHGAPGMIAICGTGSMLLLVDQTGAQHVSGGWGYLLRDAGSGYALAREGLLAVIEAEEGLGGATALTPLAHAYFQIKSPRQLIERIYTPDFTPDQMAGFARDVLTAANSGDAIARSILESNMRKLAAQAAQLMKAYPEAQKIGLYGGIFTRNAMARACFSDALQSLIPGAAICSLAYPPELGAIIHLMQQQGTLTEECLLRMKSTYEEYRK